MLYTDIRRIWKKVKLWLYGLALIRSCLDGIWQFYIRLFVIMGLHGFFAFLVLTSQFHPLITGGCNGFNQIPGNDLTAEPYSVISNISNLVTALHRCFSDWNCLSVSYDRSGQNAKLYDNWNEDKGGEYELRTRCPREPRHHYSRILDLCFSVEDTTKMTWTDASAWCSQNGRRRLLVLDSEEKVDYLLQYGAGNRRWFDPLKELTYYWIGGQYDGVQYKWVNGEVLFPNSSSWDQFSPIHSASNPYLALSVDVVEGISDSTNLTRYVLCEY